jgi:hypothetical protein
LTKDLRAMLYVVLGAFALCALLTKSHVSSWNDASRFATMDSLANRGTFAIEGSGFSHDTSDKYRYGGHVYSDKPPALELLGSGAAVVLQAAGITIADRRALWLYLITLFVIGAWFSLGCGYAFAFARTLGYTVRLSAFSAMLAGVATLNLPYATVFSNHVPCGTAVLAGLYHLFRAGERVLHTIAAGFFLSLACLFDESAGVVALMAIVMLYGAPRRRILAFASAFLPFIVLQLAFNWRYSGALIPPGMNNRFWPPALSEGASFDLRPAHEYLSHLAYATVGGNGVFLYTPLTIVCAFGFAKLRQSGNSTARRLTLAILATSALFLGLVVVFTNDALSANYGERRFVDIFFILCVGLAPAITSLRERLSSHAALVAIIASIVMAALGTINPFAGRDAPGFVLNAIEFTRLAQRSPLQAALDIAALVALFVFVVRFWRARLGAETTNGGALMLAGTPRE